MDAVTTAAGAAVADLDLRVCCVETAATAGADATDTRLLCAAADEEEAVPTRAFAKELSLLEDDAIPGN